METTALTIQIGPGTRHSLERLAAEEGIDPATVVEQAVTVWSQLRGERERDLACVDVMEIVFRRLRPAARQEAA